MKIFSKSAILDDKIQLFIIAFLRLSTLFAFIYSIANGSLSRAGLSVLALVLLFIPDVIERQYKVRLPVGYSFLIVLFIYASIVLGGLVDFYNRFWWWDDILHTSFGVIFGFAGFVVLYVLKLQKKVMASDFILSFFALSVAVMFGAFWEVAEFFIDLSLGTNMQKSLADTMVDIMTDTLGALFSVYFGYRFMSGKTNNQGTIAKMISSFLSVNPGIKSK